MTDRAGTPVLEMSLADRVRAGDRSAEDELVVRFHRRVYVMALARTRNPETAEDLAQEVMLGVLQGLRDGRLIVGQNLSAYVHGTARNLINNHFRVCARTKAEGVILEREVGQDDPEESAAERERLEMVERALAELKPDDREILRMTLVDGLKPGEIAAQIGLTSEVVRKRKSRACKRLQQVIRKRSRFPRFDHAEGEGR